jgi:TfoX/Sxy family transcriptional regulator of competence genes
VTSVCRAWHHLGDGQSVLPHYYRCDALIWRAYLALRKFDRVLL